MSVAMHWCSACRQMVDERFRIAQHNIACAETGERSYLAGRLTMPARVFPRPYYSRFWDLGAS